MAESPTPKHAICILVIVLSIIGLPLMMPEGGDDGDPLFPPLGDLKPFLMFSPLILLLLVRALASSPAANLCLNADADSIYRLVGSSIGVLLLLVIILAMISFRSVIQESWGVTESE